MKKARSDHNQAAIFRALRDMGASVTSLHRVGQGCPDALIGFRDINWVFEIKNIHGRNILTPAQIEWLGNWNGQADVVRSIDDCLKVMGMV